MRNAASTPSRTPLPKEVEQGRHLGPHIQPIRIGGGKETSRSRSGGGKVGLAPATASSGLWESGEIDLVAHLNENLEQGRRERHSEMVAV